MRSTWLGRWTWRLAVSVLEHRSKADADLDDSAHVAAVLTRPQDVSSNQQFATTLVADGPTWLAR